ncbi:ABC transporter permease, partial [Acinetobacter baumannii]|nr:ABC transporter permease [Acinetobacter baumannii]
MKKINFSFSVTRWIGVVIKEIHELRRDKVSISMVLLTPLFQLIILGYAINMDPHNLPTALLNYATER